MMDGSPRWFRWQDAAHPGWHNMAVDHALLDLAAREGVAVLRVYGWEPHCLSFGRHEPAARRYGRPRVEALGVDCVRRPTGGRAVWHGRELTYAVAAPAAPAAAGGLARAHDAIHRMLRDALRSLGAPAELAPRPTRTPGPGAGACFATPLGGEVTVAGRKVAGSAQLRERDAFLQHGALLLADDQTLVHSLAGAGPGPRPEVTLAEVLGRPVSFAEAAAAIFRAAEPWSAAWDPFDPDRIRPGVAAHARRYRSPEWTWDR